MNKTIKKIVKGWGVAFVIGAMMFLVLRPRLVEAFTRQEIHGMYLASQGVRVSLEERNGRKQVVYDIESEHEAITDDQYVKGEPDTERGEIVWMALIESNWQIFRHNLITQETTQLTSFGNNVNPRVSGGRIVWETYVDGAWQVMLWDKGELRQMTEGRVASGEVDLYEDWLVYRRQTADKTSWRIVLENLLTGEVVDMGEGIKPRFEGAELVWRVVVDGKEKEERFSFEVKLDEEPTPTSRVELEASVSAEVEVVEEASGSAEATESGEVE